MSRFSRLLIAQVYAEPEPETTVPKSGLAMTLTQGSGVSWSPSSTMAYALPSSVNPPDPLANVRSGDSIATPSRSGTGDRRWHRQFPLPLRLGIRPVELVGEFAALAAQDRARRRRQEDALGFAHPVTSQQEHAARPVLPGTPRTGVEQCRELHVHLVQVAHRMLVQDDDIGTLVP